MDLIKITIFAFMLSECHRSTKVMGFTSQSPNKTRKASLTTKHLLTNQSSVTTKHLVNQSNPSYPSTNQGTTGHQTTDRVSTRPETTVHVTTQHSPTNQSTTSHPSTFEKTTGYSKTGAATTTTPMCPLNMEYGNCTTCQGTCMDPTGCISNCTEPKTCVCTDGYLLKGDDCVPQEECACFVDGEGEVPEGVLYVSSNCSYRCSCTNGQLTCDDDYQCSPNAVCEERNNTLQCYCKAGYTGDGVNCVQIANSDCKDVYERGSNGSGVYKLKPTTWKGEPFDVYCNMTNGGGWTVFQRRFDGSQEFFLYWSDYRDGFGIPDREFWLGNEKLHSLTTQKTYELRVDIVDSLGNSYYAQHSLFYISDENDNYRLTLGSFNGGDAGDGLSVSNGQAFTTRDNDNDIWVNGNCGTRTAYGCGHECRLNAAWWYKDGRSCSLVHLNSPYGSNCLRWIGIPGSDCNITYTEMKVRPI